MNHMPIETDEKDEEELMWPTTIIAGASTLLINDENDLLLPAINHQPSSVSTHSGKKSIFINHLCQEPLVIDCQSAKSLDITIKDGADVQVLLKTSLKHEIKVILKDNAKACFYLIGDEGPEVLSFNVLVGEKAQFELFEIKTSPTQSTNTIDVELLEKDAQFTYFALDLLYGLAHKKTALTIYHRAKNTTSVQNFRGIYSGASHGTFFGKVVVDQCASLSSAKQLYRSIILSSKAKAHTMPQLEIYNHDISASHGASIGELDSNALFYLCSRGLSLVDAKSLLIRGLINEVLDQVKEEAFKKSLGQLVEKAIKKAIEDCA